MARLFDDPSSQYLSHAAAVLTAPPFSLGAWVRSDDITSAQNILALGVAGSGNQQWSLLLAGTTAGDPIQFLIRTTANTIVATTTGFSADVWHYVMAVEGSATDHRVYIDGGSEGASTQSRAPTGADVTYIGARPGTSPTGFMSGRIAWPCIWNVALTAEERLALARGVHPYKIRPEAIVTLYLLGYESPEPDLSPAIVTATRFNMTLNNAPVRADGPPATLWTPKWWPAVIVAAAGQTVAVGQVTETDAAQAVTWAPKHRLVAQIAEADLSQPVARLKTAAVAQVTESDLAQVVASLKARQLGQVTETDLAQAIGRLKTKLLGLTSEIDLAQTITEAGAGEIIVPVGQVTESDLAQAVARLKIVHVVQAVEVNLSQGIGRLKTVAVTLVTETDLAQAVGRLKAVTVTQVVEFDLAQTITWAPKHRFVGQVTETNLAQAITFQAAVTAFITLTLPPRSFTRGLSARSFDRTLSARSFTRTAPDEKGR